MGVLKRSWQHLVDRLRSSPASDAPSEPWQQRLLEHWRLRYLQLAPIADQPRGALQRRVLRYLLDRYGHRWGWNRHRLGGQSLHTEPLTGSSIPLSRTFVPARRDSLLGSLVRDVADLNAGFDRSEPHVARPPWFIWVTRYLTAAMVGAIGGGAIGLLAQPIVSFSFGSGAPLAPLGSLQWLLAGMLVGVWVGPLLYHAGRKSAAWAMAIIIAQLGLFGAVAAGNLAVRFALDPRRGPWYLHADRLVLIRSHLWMPIVLGAALGALAGFCVAIRRLRQ